MWLVYCVGVSDSVCVCVCVCVNISKASLHGHFTAWVLYEHLGACKLAGSTLYEN